MCLPWGSSVVTFCFPKLTWGLFFCVSAWQFGCESITSVPETPKRTYYAWKPQGLWVIFLILMFILTFMCSPTNQLTAGGSDGWKHSVCQEVYLSWLICSIVSSSGCQKNWYNDEHSRSVTINISVKESSLQSHLPVSCRGKLMPRSAIRCLRIVSDVI